MSYPYKKGHPCHPETDNYFHCVIGPIKRKILDRKYPNGEGRLRGTIQKVYRETFGSEQECGSGWGMTLEGKDNAWYAAHQDETKIALIQSYHDEGKSVPRGLRAWELLLIEEGKF